MAGIEYPLRRSFDLSLNWGFIRRKADKDWLSAEMPDDEVTVNLPHCWNSTDAFQHGVEYYRGPGAYRKTFAFPEDLKELSGGRWFLETEGFYGTGDLWINGRKVAIIDGQYLGVSVDVSAYVQPGRSNTVGIRLTNRCSRSVLPGIDMPDFLLYGGMSGRVKMVNRPDLRVERIRPQLRSLSGSRADWQLDVTFSVVNDSDEMRNGKTSWYLKDRDGKVLCSADADLDVLERASIQPDLETGMALTGVKPWSPDEPHLYDLVCDLVEGDVAVDTAVLRIGCREALFLQGGGFAINGQRIELRGCNRHENMPGFGRGLPESFHREDAQRIKELGLNFVRLSHYPQHPAFLDACDELGILVFPEIATWKSVKGWGAWLRSACRQMEAMVVRDMHHPSVILWGMGNESRSRRAYLKLRSLVQDLDPGRPVTYAENHFYRARRKNTLGLVDVWGLNYELDAIEDGRRSCTLENVLVTECANYPKAHRGNLAEEFEQVKLIASTLDSMSGTKGVSGFALWCFNDYSTLRKGRFLRYSGIVDAWRLPKMSGSFLQARFGAKPFIRLFADWSVQGDNTKPGEASRTVYLITNCDDVEILVNGRAVSSLNGKPFHTAQVPFEAGELLARGGSGDVSVCDRIESWSQAESIVILPDRFEARSCEREVVGLMVRVIDGDGRHVRSFIGSLSISLEGPGVLRSFTQDGRVLMSGGEGRCFVEGNGTAGKVEIAVAGCELDAGVSSFVFK